MALLTQRLVLTTEWVVLPVVGRILLENQGGTDIAWAATDGGELTDPAADIGSAYHVLRRRGSSGRQAVVLRPFFPQTGPPQRIYVSAPYGSGSVVYTEGVASGP